MLNQSTDDMWLFVSIILLRETKIKRYDEKNDESIIIT